MNEQAIKVGIVEDVAGTRDALAALVEGAEGLVCVCATNSGEAALSKLPPMAPDIVLMDIKLPGMSGIKCVSELKRALPQTQVLMLTTYEDSELIFDALRSGASGYLLKKTHPQEIIQAIHQAHDGGSPMSVHVARKVVDHFQRISQTATEVDRLTPREHEILVLLAKGFRYKEIVDQLNISLSTVRTHIRAVYEKLHVQSRTEAVVKYLEQNPASAAAKNSSRH
jgi:DNA-binding NarL/FixJ family response regulator